MDIQEPAGEMMLYGFHVFTSGLDRRTDDLSTALMWFYRFVRTYNSARLYIEIDVGNNGDYDYQDCLMSHGEYPL